MVKRIQCRVVRSVPLGGADWGLRPETEPNYGGCRVGSVDGVDARYASAGRPFAHQGWPATGKTPVGVAPAGQVVDCYV
ncbi:MAG: hypothetical protein ACYTBJ_01445 [Planctomycetota bacterium]